MGSSIQYGSGGNHEFQRPVIAMKHHQRFSDYYVVLIGIVGVLALTLTSDQQLPLPSY